MKQLLFLILATLVLSFTTNDEKKYPLSYTQGQYDRKLNLLLSAANLIDQSDAPTKIGRPIADSLRQFAQEIIDQIRPQLPKSEKK